MMEKEKFENLKDEPTRLKAAIEAGNPTTQLLVLVQLTRDEEWLDEAGRYIKGPMDYHNKMPAELVERIRRTLYAVLLEMAGEGQELPGVPRHRLLKRMLSVAAGEDVGDEYLPLMYEELTIPEVDHRAVGIPDTQERKRDFHVLIIGAGMSGICAAIRLQEAGIPFNIIEKNPTVGGTWLENRYPGCGVDTPNHFYSYSFEPKHDWSHFFAKREEIWNYFRDVAAKYRLFEKIAFNTEVTSARFSEETRTWHVHARDADDSVIAFEASALITAVGVLNRPKVPEIPGQEEFEGPAFHTARWDPDFNWKNKRVAMIGTGASGQQVAPRLAPGVERLGVFQRSPHWVVPNPNYFKRVSAEEQWAFANIPYYARWHRFQLFWAFGDSIYPALQVDPNWPERKRSINRVNDRHRQFMERHIEKELGDRPDLLPKVTPNYPPYGKRILIDNDWYKMLRRDNVDLITEDISHIDRTGIVTNDGRHWAADAIVYATGFHAEKMLWPMEIVGRESIDLRQLWGGDNARAYLGTVVPGFPNLFLLEGPNTGLAHGGNQIFMTECQVRYVMLAIQKMIQGGHEMMEVKKNVFEEYNEKVDDLHQSMVWTHQGMTNWFRNKRGRVFAISPWRLVEFWRMTASFEEQDYCFDDDVANNSIAAGAGQEIGA